MEVVVDKITKYWAMCVAIFKKKEREDFQTQK